MHTLAATALLALSFPLSLVGIHTPTLNTTPPPTPVQSTTTLPTPTDTSTSTKDRHAPTTVKNDANIACVQTAVATRESNLLIDLNTYRNEYWYASIIRKSELTNAFVFNHTADSINAAVKAGWTKYVTARNTAQDKYKKAQELDWTTYNAAIAKCGTAAAGLSDKKFKGSDGRILPEGL